MSEAARLFLRSFHALARDDQHDVLVSLLRLPLEGHYTAPSDQELVDAAELVFLGLDETEKQP